MSTLVLPPPACGNFGEQNICASLCAYYPLDEANGEALDEATPRYDLTDNGNVGSTTGKVTSPDGIKRARTFNVGQKLSHGHETCFSIQEGGTIAGWVRVHTTTLEPWAFAAKGSSGEEWSLFAVFDSLSGTNNFRFNVVKSDDTTVSVNSGTGYLTDEWYFVAAQVDTDALEVRLRVDDTVFTQPYTGTLKSPGSSNDFFLGMLLDGDMDSWSVSDSLLTTAEFDYLYNDGYGRPISCSVPLSNSACAYYRLDESSGNAVDQTTNHFNLTEHGTVGTTTGLIGNARTFNGVDQYFTHAAEDCFSVQQGGAVWGWFRTSTPQSSVLVAKASAISVPEEWRMYTLQASTRFALTIRISPSSQAVSILSFPNEFDGNWHFTAWSYDPVLKTSSQLLDGTYYNFSVANQQYVPPDPTVDLGMASFNDGGTTGTGTAVGPFDGDLDQWGFSCRALTEDELRYLYNNGNGRQLL